MAIDGRDLIEKVDKIKGLSYLLEFDDEKISELRELINQYKQMNNISLILNIPDTIKEFRESLDKNIDFKNTNNVELIIKIDTLINIELMKLNKIKEKLFNIINFRSIYKTNNIKEKLENKEYLSLSDIFELRNSKNEDTINSILKIIDLLNNSTDLQYEINSKKIMFLEKQLIFDIEMELNHICDSLGINYNNKSIVDKYFDIIDCIKVKEYNYSQIREQYKKIYDANKINENNVIKGIIKTFKGTITLDNFKYICDEGLDKILHILRTNFRVKDLNEYIKSLEKR